MTETEVRKILEESRALLSGHFKLSSGRHSENYLQCALVLQYPDKAGVLCKFLAGKCRGRFGRIDAVASPAVGGVVIGQEIARALGVRHIFSERGGDDKMVFRRGFSVEKGEKLLLADDVLTTGLSLKELTALVESHNAAAAGWASLAERGAGKEFSVERECLIRLDFKDYDAAECPACKKGIPVEKPGTRPEKISAKRGAIL